MLQVIPDQDYVELEDDDLVVVASPAFSKSCALTGWPTLGQMPSLKDITEYVPSSYSVGMDQSKPMNLNYEFSLLNYSDKLRVEAQDSMERIFTVSAATTKNQLVLNVKFPPNYPNQTAPIFSFLEGTTIDNVSRNNILQKLRIAAKHQTSRNR
jgi:hypothetical protein